MSRSVLLNTLALASTAYAYGRWGDDYDGDGPSYGDAGYVPGSGDSNGFGDQFGNGIGLEYGTASRYRVIHGTLAALAFVGIFPVGAILIRVIPGRLSYLVHGLVQLLAFIVYICGAALGIYLVKTIRIPPNGQSLLSIPRVNAHPIIGIIILVVLFFQPALGWIHHLRYKRLGCRTAWSYAHIWVGRVAITLGIINGGLGLGFAQASHSAIVAYSVIAAVMWLLWVAATVWSVSRRQRDLAPGVKSPDDRGPSPLYTPGPIYGGPSVESRERMRGVEMGRVKHVNRSGSVSTVSSYSRR